MKSELLERLRVAGCGGERSQGRARGRYLWAQNQDVICKPRICRAFCLLTLPSAARDRASALGERVVQGSCLAGPEMAVII